ncbi:MAG: type II toxin-antitoxin system RelE/ParE family toxin [Prevotellaceae bacterium]|jgi:plasmid stabilization system protein ParE|nr:type II toxin-antitoxin system RelE/ParE family toxin [Prevotellaceae bacterium]GHT31844.1 hypothetical protein FACS189434_02360 [Bacteroidia bacterium]
MRYKIKLSNDAQYDFDNYIDYILFECGAPLTAIKHYEGITRALNDLSKNPFINNVRDNAFFKTLGMNVRRENYKKMAIIYTVNEDTVFIHRIIASSLITELN